MAGGSCAAAAIVSVWQARSASRPSGYECGFVGSLWLRPDGRGRVGLMKALDLARMDHFGTAGSEDSLK